MGMVAAVIGQALNLGVRAWERGNSISDSSHNLLEWQIVTRQIRSFFPAKGEKNTVFFKGDKNELSFISAYSLRWADQAGLVRVIYRIEESSDDTVRFMVFEEPFLNAKRLEEEVKEDDFVELTSVKGSVEFAYEKVSATQTTTQEEEGEWKSKWDDGDTSIPSRVKILLPSNSGSDNDEPLELIATIMAEETKQQ